MTENMGSVTLEDLSLYINTKISKIKKYLQLRKIGEDNSLKALLHKIGKDMFLLNDLLDKMETEVNQQEKKKHLLKELQQAAERDLKEAEHLLEHIPSYLPKPTQECVAVPTVKREEQTKEAEPEAAKKPAKKERVIKEIALLTAEEFKGVPGYLKGRLACDHINAVVQEINKAVVSKYKIMHRPVKSMSFSNRSLYDRFVQEETKVTKGEFFVVEDDIKAFTSLKLDKRFHNIVSILRHCHRLRKVHSQKLVLYVLC